MILYRTDGAWGTGKGANLTPVEVDSNFYDVDSRVTYIETNPVAPIEPISIAISGSQFSMGLSNGETLGPITITMPMPHWRGNWVASVHYNEMDFFTAPDGGFGAVMVPHNSVEPFDWGRVDGGLLVYLELVGATGTTAGLGDLVGVSLTPGADGDFLIYDGPGALWRNRTKADVAHLILPAFAGDHGAGGAQGMVPAAAAGDAAAGKVLSAGGTWIIPTVGGSGSSSLAGLSDVAIVSPANLSLLQYSTTDGKWHNQTLATLGAGTVTNIATGTGLVGGPITGTGTISLATVATLTLLANVTGSAAAPAPVTLSTLLDAALGSARGMVLRRGGTEWTALAPGTAGQYLATGGPGNDVTWQTAPGSGTVSQVNSGPGLTGGPITASGTLSLATIVDNTLLANVTGSTTTPAATTVTQLLDHALGATQGQILYRDTAAWAVLAPGTAGQLLRTGGAGANPSWVAGSGSGTVTQVNTGTGLIGGPITTTGTVSLATIANQTLLSNISGATAAPSANSLSAIIDAVFSSTRGSVLYRGAAGWAALGPGTAGQALTTGGAGADPAWAAGGGGSTTTISDTPPGSPTVGSGWWDSVGGQLYLWYDDGTSSQWVPATNQTGLFSTPLSVANGGTGTTTAFTAGSIVFAGAGGAYSQDNGALFWDDTNNRLGVGTATPGYRLDVNGSANVSGALTTGGNVGIGTATPVAKLDVVGGSIFIPNEATGAYAARDSGGTPRLVLAVGNNAMAIDVTRLRSAGGGVSIENLAGDPLVAILNGGNVGIGTVSPGQKVHITSGASTRTSLMMTDGNTASLFMAAGASLPATLAADSSLAFRTSVSYPNADTGILAMTIAVGSGATANITGVWTTISAREMKEEVAPYTRGLDALVQLQPCVFRYRPGTPFAKSADEPSDLLIGLMADEVEPHVPEIVGEMTTTVGDKSDVAISTLAPGLLVFALINSTKELANTITELTARIAALEARP